MILPAIHLDHVRFPAREEAKRISFRRIVGAVERFYQLKPGSLRDRTRARRIVWPRQVAFVLARKLTHLSLSDMARRMGDFDHATALYAIHRVEAACKANPTLDAEVKEIERMLRGAS